MSARKVLISPTWGAGWTTWNSGEVAKLMLTYPPIVEFLEGGGKFTGADSEAKYDNSVYVRGSLHPVLEKLRDECEQRFGEGYVCLLGASGLQVVPVSGRVRIDEYDGNESLEEEGDSEEKWL